MVKPAGPYLDVIRAPAPRPPPCRIAAYQVSGEYAMLHAAAAAGALDRRAATLESLSRSAAPGRRIYHHLQRHRGRAVAGLVDDAIRRAAATPRRVRHIPGGVNSPVRAMRAVGRDHPLFIARRRGAEVADADGNRYVDLRRLVGADDPRPRHPAVVAAVREAARARHVLRRADADGDRLREPVSARSRRSSCCASSRRGTEATMSALRARPRRHRPRRRAEVRRLLPRPRRRAARRRPARARDARHAVEPRRPAPPSPPTPSRAVQRPRRRSSSAFAAHGARLACAIVEPVPGNMGVRPAGARLPGAAARACAAAGALLSSTRSSPASASRRAAPRALRRRARPHLLRQDHRRRAARRRPSAAGARLMELLAPLGPTYQAGTLSGNPLAMAAGLATLDELLGAGRLRPPGAHERRARGRDPRGPAGAAVTRQPRRLDADAVLPSRPGALVRRRRGGRHRALRPPLPRTACPRASTSPPSQYEAAFVSLAHGEAEIDARPRPSRSFAAAERAAAPA